MTSIIERKIKRERRPNFSQQEINDLVNAVLKHKGVINSSNSQQHARFVRQEAWNDVCREVNIRSPNNRSVVEVRNKLKEFKATSKKKLKQYNLEVINAGPGEIEPILPPEITPKVLEILAGSVEEEAVEESDDQPANNLHLNLPTSTSTTESKSHKDSECIEIWVSPTMMMQPSKVVSFTPKNDERQRDPDKRRRKPNFTGEETRALINGILKHKGVLNTKNAAKISYSIRRAAWAQVCKEVNMHSTHDRSITEIMHKFKTFKNNAKKEVANYNRESSLATPGGFFPRLPAYITQQVLEMLGDQAEAATKPPPAPVYISKQVLEMLRGQVEDAGEPPLQPSQRTPASEPSLSSYGAQIVSALHRIGDLIEQSIAIQSQSADREDAYREEMLRVMSSKATIVSSRKPRT